MPNKRKMWTTTFYKSFFQKYFVGHEESAVKNSFSTYVCYGPDGLFWLNLYSPQSWFLYLDSGIGRKVYQSSIRPIWCSCPSRCWSWDWRTSSFGMETTRRSCTWSRGLGQREARRSMEGTHRLMRWNLTSKKFPTETEYGVWKLIVCSFTYQSQKNPFS